MIVKTLWVRTGPALFSFPRDFLWCSYVHLTHQCKLSCWVFLLFFVDIHFIEPCWVNVYTTILYFSDFSLTSSPLLWSLQYVIDIVTVIAGMWFKDSSTFLKLKNENAGLFRDGFEHLGARGSSRSRVLTPVAGPRLPSQKSPLGQHMWRVLTYVNRWTSPSPQVCRRFCVAANETVSFNTRQDFDISLRSIFMIIWMI